MRDGSASSASTHFCGAVAEAQRARADEVFRVAWAKASAPRRRAALLKQPVRRPRSGERYAPSSYPFAAAADLPRGSLRTSTLAELQAGALERRCCVNTLSGGPPSHCLERARDIRLSDLRAASRISTLLRATRDLQSMHFAPRPYTPALFVNSLPTITSIHAAYRTHLTPRPQVSSATAASIALPSIGRSLSVPEDQLQWLLSAFSLSSGGLLVFFGRLADLHGRRRAFVAGSAWLGVFSLGCGFARGIVPLAVLRALQGMGPAATVPASVRRFFLVNLRLLMI